MKCGKKDKEMLHAKMRSVFKLYSNHLNAQLSTQQMTGWDQRPVHFTTQLPHIYSPLFSHFRMPVTVMAQRLLSSSLLTLLLAAGASAQGENKICKTVSKSFLSHVIMGGASNLGWREEGYQWPSLASSCDFDLLCIKISLGFSHHH